MYFSVHTEGEILCLHGHSHLQLLIEHKKGILIPSGRIQEVLDCNEF